MRERVGLGLPSAGSSEGFILVCLCDTIFSVPAFEGRGANACEVCCEKP